MMVAIPGLCSPCLKLRLSEFQVQVLVQRGQEDVQRRLQLAQVQAGQAGVEAALHLDPGGLAASQTLEKAVSCQFRPK